MTDNDITTICSKIESLHIKILKSNFSEMVTESEILCLILAVQELNRQKAEINKLTYQVNRLKKYDEERDIRLHSRLTTTAKAEAIKEFAERLKKEKYYGSNWMGYGTWVVEVDDIDNLVKEMVGEG